MNLFKSYLNQSSATVCIFLTLMQCDFSSCHRRKNMQAEGCDVSFPSLYFPRPKAVNFKVYVGVVPPQIR